MYELDGRRAREQVGLVLPTSLCSGQIALRLADQAERGVTGRAGARRAPSRCRTPRAAAVSAAPSEETYARMMIGYLAAPASSALALLLEHGCEKTHNDYFRSRLVEARASTRRRFGWASIQLDGGIEAATERVRDWFEGTSLTMPAPSGSRPDSATSPSRLDARGPLGAGTARALAEVGGWVVGQGGSVLLASTRCAARARRLPRARVRVARRRARHARPRPARHPPRLARDADARDRLDRGRQRARRGRRPGAAGARRRRQRVRAAAAPRGAAQLRPCRRVARYAADLDGVRPGRRRRAGARLRPHACRRRVRPPRPAVLETGNVGFQVTRGRLGTSM